MGPPEKSVAAGTGIPGGRTHETPPRQVAGPSRLSVGTSLPGTIVNVRAVDGCSVGGRPWSITASVATAHVCSDAAEDHEDHVSDAKRTELRKKGRERGRWELRARLRSVSQDRRTRTCGAICVREGGAAIEVKRTLKGAAARWQGIGRCGHVHTCPVCAAEIRAKRRDQVIRAVSAGMKHKPELSWVMVTFTIRHHYGADLEVLRRGLMTAFRKTRQRGTVQRMWKRMVAATIRAFEVTHGAHGWHPHVHVLVQTERWSDQERAELVRTWRQVVAKVLGEKHIPDEDIGIKWSRPIRSATGASYLTKLGLEMSWGEKRARGVRSRGPWSIARDAVDGDAQSVMLWRDYERATKGLRVLELDDRAARYAKEEPEFREDGDAPCAECGHPKRSHGQLGGGACLHHARCTCEKFVPEIIGKTETETIEVDSYAIFLLRMGEKRQPSIFWNVLRAVEDEPLRASEVIDEWIALCASWRTEERSRLYGPD